MVAANKTESMTVTIDVNKNNQDNPVVKSFSAGTYEVKLAGAWNKWGGLVRNQGGEIGLTVKCDPNGENCDWGWVNEYSLASSEFTIDVPTTDKYETPELAIQKAKTISFTLKSDGEVYLFIKDDQIQDNRGNLSLAVKKVSQSDSNPSNSGAGLPGKPPQFGGSTGGLLTKADVEEKYAITWTSTKEQVFEMPTGGAAIMNQGENILYLARKEQCIALGGQLRNKIKPKIDNYKIYRIYPNGEVQYLHPADGVFPEKVNQGRPYVGKKDRSIGENPEPASLKFSGNEPYDV